MVSEEWIKQALKIMAHSAKTVPGLIGWTAQRLYDEGMKEMYPDMEGGELKCPITQKSM